MLNPDLIVKRMDDVNWGTEAFNLVRDRWWFPQEHGLAGLVVGDISITLTVCYTQDYLVILPVGKIKPSLQSVCSTTEVVNIDYYATMEVDGRGGRKYVVYGPNDNTLQTGSFSLGMGYFEAMHKLAEYLRNLLATAKLG